ncbi:trehalose-6-phosphate synthase [Pedobacter roseus]|uniref:Trehalose-6-phosphate synthase n=1 Tax=Pedobacter roseus TaxID=336820 RepID=A0A7G9QKT0_9SPHI|nr:trehalose-6-phosphate synthase [Pedobacter roseus]QNN43955.1 trehalose-6-phosphate synthase [Pedobacter roseus]
MDQKNIVIYHRQPYIEKALNGKVVFYKEGNKPNGIIPLLMSFFSSIKGGLWIAGSEFAEMSGKEQYEKVKFEDYNGECRIKKVLITKEENEKFYHETSKNGFWSILHSSQDKFNSKNIDWENFVLINKRFADSALIEVGDESTIWIHDYNLWLVPLYIRQKNPAVKIIFFLHTPFPSADIFNILPWRDEILLSLLSCNKITFAIPRYVENFISTLKSNFKIKIKMRTKVPNRFLNKGALIEHEMTKKISFNGNIIELDAYPPGTSQKNINRMLNLKASKKRIEELRQEQKGRVSLLAASRLDYIKGIDTLLEAYYRLLVRNFVIHNKITLTLIAVSPASGIKAFNELESKVFMLVNKINSRFGGNDWTPVIYLTDSFNFQEMLCRFSVTDIMCVTSLRDGTNLVCKEFIAVKKGKSGTLILSEFVGASVELKGAIITNPYSDSCIDQAFNVALSSSIPEIKERAETMYNSIKKSDVSFWSKQIIK